MITKRDPDSIRSYFEDSSNLSGGHAAEVVMPETIDELSGFLRDAHARRLAVNISGGGTGTTGARIPFGGVVLSLERFDRIIDLRRETMAAVVQAGVTVDALRIACEERGLFYPCHPTERTAFVGGTIATNASGARSFKYGPTRGFVRRLTMVLADGTIATLERGAAFLTRKHPVVTLGGKRITVPLPGYTMPAVKHAAGYFAREGMDAIDLFIGQEGTLSVITEAVIGLVPKPAGIFGCFVFFVREADAWAFAYEAARTSRERSGGVDALSIEYFDRNAVAILRTKNANVPADAVAAIFFEQEVPGEAGDVTIAAWEDLIVRHGSSLEATWVAMNEHEIEAFAELRHAIPEAVNDTVRRSGFRKFSTDIAVPREQLITMMRWYEDHLNRHAIPHIVFGHIGECHLHVNILPRSAAEAASAQAMCEAFIGKAVALGGTVSAEHGIGKTRHAYLRRLYGERGIIEMARIKKAFDPSLILGPGTIFPQEAAAGA